MAMTLGKTRRRLFAGLGVVLVSALVGLFVSALVGGRGSHEPDTSGLPGGVTTTGTDKFSMRAAQAGLDRQTSIVATAREHSVLVRKQPLAGASARRVTARSSGTRRLPLVFLVERRRPGWLQVYLPVRPNRSSAWIRASDVRLAADPYRVEVRLRSHRLLAWSGSRRILTRPIAVGKALSPTPTGRYYITDLLRPPNPSGFYGPYAFGLSAHSPVFTSFEGGDGQVGIHGTNDPSVIGSDVSHGCIRVSNATITRLARLLPLGTPVTIRR
jgi:lipoprotein-anchoring transpeptidase ErfK/SrfK